MRKGPLPKQRAYRVYPGMRSPDTSILACFCTKNKLKHYISEPLDSSKGSERGDSSK